MLYVAEVILMNVLGERLSISSLQVNESTAYIEGAISQYCRPFSIRPRNEIAAYVEHRTSWGGQLGWSQELETADLQRLCQLFGIGALA